MMYSRFVSYIALLLISAHCFSQEGIPIYSDYLSDNYYLIHPSMAGAANCDKIRLTIRNQWFGHEDAPAFQTLSYNTRFDEKSAGGIILFNDKNGYYSQKGIQLTYAHHIMFSRDAIDLNQLSFGISGGITQSQLDETHFLDSGVTDPIIKGNVESETHVNFDIGTSYNYLDMYFHLTAKNVLETKQNKDSNHETSNLRKYLFSTGYIFGNSDWLSWEPSVMFQFTEMTKEKTLDVNLKTYKNFSEGMLWAGLSYRTGLDAQHPVNGTSKQKLQYLTPIIGINYRNFLFAYTYSSVFGSVKFDNGAYHQLTLGMNFACRKEKYDCNCPAVN